MSQADWDTDEGLEEIAKFCRNGFPVRSGIERLRNAHDTDRRVEYFRGEKLTIFLLGDLDDECGFVWILDISTPHRAAAKYK